MFVKVQIFATEEEFKSRKEGFEEFNDTEYMMDQFNQDCIDDFFANRSDYLDPDNCEVIILWESGIDK